MRVRGTQAAAPGKAAHAAQRSRRRVAPSPATLRPVPAPRPKEIKLPGTISRAGGSWTVDSARAIHDAQWALNAIDWTKRDIVIWVPGTSNHTIHRRFEQSVQDSWKGAASLVRLEYEATWHMRRSMPTGIATLRLVLAGIAAHGGNHRVMLAGESQGAWIIGETLADPMMRRTVSRAVLMGHPWHAAHHYDDGHDHDIAEINHDQDMVAMPVKGDVTKAFDALIALNTLQLNKVGLILGALAANAQHGALLLTSALRATLLRGVLADPHDYTNDMRRAVEYLRLGSPLAARAAAA